MDAQTIDDARLIDLIARVEKDLGEMGKRSGRWMLFCCPFHDDKNPSLGVTNGDAGKGPYFECYACGEKGSAIDWIMKFHKMDFKQAIEELTQGRIEASSNQARAARKEPTTTLEQPPGEEWQRRAYQLIEGAHDCLFSEDGYYKKVGWKETDPETGKPVVRLMSPIDYLFSRGLREETLRIWKIGYIPRTWHEKAERWGLSGKDITISQGILIPWIINNQVWKLKVKIPVPGSRDKYIQIRGAGSHHAIYMLPTVEWNDTVVFCEGEFDALLLWQEVEGLAGVVTLGPNLPLGRDNDAVIASWGLYLISTKTRLIAYDVDGKSEEGAAGLAWLSNSRRVNIPQLRAQDKDITDFWRSGGDLRAWLQAELEAVKG